MAKNLPAVAADRRTPANVAIQHPTPPSARLGAREAAPAVTGRRGLTAIAGLGIAAALTVLAGCSTMFEPVNQEVALRTAVGDERVEAVCEVSNDKGRWTVNTPVNFAVTRSSAPLKVECQGSDGLVASRSFETVGSGNRAVKGSNVASGYPYLLEVSLGQPDPTLQGGGRGQAGLIDPARLPFVDADGRAGYARFLKGEQPRAFAISDNGQWIRVNGARSAGRLAMERCVALGGNCQLFAIDNDVVWEDHPTTRLAATR